MELTIDEINNLVKNNETLINKNNRLEEELNQTKLLLEGKNTEFNELFKYIIEDLKPHAHLYKTALEEIRNIINEACWDYTDITILPIKDNILDKIKEVLNENKEKTKL